MMKDKILLLGISILSVVLLFGTVDKTNAVTDNTFRTTLNGEQEVPPVETSGNGQASFQMQDDSMSYQINVQNTDKVTGIHIHQGESGQNGDVIVTLYSPDTKLKDRDQSLFDKLSSKLDVSTSTVQRSSQYSYSGNFHASDLQGPLEGKTLNELTSLMAQGQTYLNVHTESSPDGEIRGQIGN